MFYYVEGTVAAKLSYLAVIDCGGIGFSCKIGRASCRERV